MNSDDECDSVPSNIEEQSKCSIASSLSSSIGRHDDDSHLDGPHGCLKSNFYTPARGNKAPGSLFNSLDQRLRRVHFAADKNLETYECPSGRTLNCNDLVDMEIETSGFYDDTFSRPGTHESKPATGAGHGTFLPNYTLGDKAYIQDMSADWTFEKINSLQKHCFAFVLRSSGLFTYAIVAHRQKDMILFVVDTLGSIKLMSKRRWLSSIRLVNQQDNSAPVVSPIKKGTNSTASNSCGNQLRPPQLPRSGDQRKKSPDAAAQNLFGLGSRSQPDAFPRSL